MASTLPVDVQRKIEWYPEYNNEEIMEIFNQVDCIVVPSIWVENSPLVIHEAQQVGVPVITANVGGMKEFVHHNKNGLLFDFRNSESLRHHMQQLVDNPKWAKDLGQKRYLYSKTGDVVFIDHHVEQIETIYKTLLKRSVA
jgi:glycosyltransferase involved in cell wall biosynthesis